jgi:diketogulonate reductase-like aldo/keto reductase
MGAATSALLLLLLHLATCLWPMAARAASSASSATGDHIVLGSGSTAVTLPTVINGCWQFAGGHGQLSRPDLVDAMKSLRGAGLYAFDTADIYGPSEEIVGEFVKRTLAEGGSSQPEPPPVILTKLVPRSDDAPADVFTATIERSLRALNVQTLDVVQFHTWDYAGAFTKPLQRLQQLQGDGKIKQIGLTNFDTLHMTAALDGGFPIVSNQVPTVDSFYRLYRFSR